MNEKKKLSRRLFIKRSSWIAAGVTGGVFAAATPFLKAGPLRLRPPGALDETLFLASCIKCGQCLQVCPPKILHLDGLTSGFGVGTPYIEAREGACILCKGLPCVLACPTGALAHDIAYGKEAEMGLAVLERPKQCLSALGVNDLIYRIDKFLEGKGRIMETKRKHELANDLWDFFGEVKQAALREEWGFKYKRPRPAQVLKKERLLALKRELETQYGVEGCRLCLTKCPIAAEGPIHFEFQQVNGIPSIVPQVQDTCVGCGVCEEVCPVEPSCITVTPRLRPVKERVRV